jgi:hypothetical protein
VILLKNWGGKSFARCMMLARWFLFARQYGCVEAAMLIPIVFREAEKQSEIRVRKIHAIRGWVGKGDFYSPAVFSGGNPSAVSHPAKVL